MQKCYEEKIIIALLFPAHFQREMHLNHLDHIDYFQHHQLHGRDNEYSLRQTYHHKYPVLDLQNLSNIVLRYQYIQ